MINPQDFVLQFEAEGSTLVFQDLVIEYPWVPMDSLVLFDDNRVQSYMSKNVLKALDKEGESCTVEQTERIIESLSAKVRKAIEEREHFESKPEFSREDFNYMAETLQTIAKEYFYFDSIYWDSVYENRDQNAEFRKNIKLVEGFKNVVRIELGKIYLDKDSYLQIMLKRLSEKFNKPINDLGWYLVKELQGLFDGTSLASEEINSRMNQYVLHWKVGEGSILYSTKKAQEIISSFKNNVGLKATLLKGRVAHSKSGDSIIRARVKIFIRNEFEENKMMEDLSEMEEGQILVALTTDPTLINMMKKASVIITDLGGMLSHAAITARELNIPCIVGVENATKVFKDGDIVEVDTLKGTVRKI